MVPKGDYVTVSLIGDRDLTKKDLLDFVNHPVVRSKLPPDWKIIGDASISRIYKNGLESAYITSQLAVQAAFEKGISKEDFSRYYYRPARKLLAMDNLFGSLIMRVSDFVTRRSWLVTARLSYVKDRKGSRMANHLNEMLWNMVTGDAPYREIILQAFNPLFQIILIPVTVKALIGEICAGLFSRKVQASRRRRGEEEKK
jgi:hypothetical protein